MTQIRVRYQETDQMGVVYHSNYLVWFEVARTEFFRASGLPYTWLEQEGVLFPVTRVEVEYRLPARYDDLIEVCPQIQRLTPVRVVLAYQVTRDGEVLANGRTEHAFTNSQGRPMNIRKSAPQIWKRIEGIWREGEENESDQKYSSNQARGPGQGSTIA